MLINRTRSIPTMLMILTAGVALGAHVPATHALEPTTHFTEARR
jgi:hypothetical protein